MYLQNSLKWGYRRPELLKINEQTDVFIETLGRLTSYDTAKELYWRYVQYYSHIHIMHDWAFVRYAENSNDPFYSREVEFFRKEKKTFLSIYVKAAKAMLASPFGERFIQEFPDEYESMQESIRRIA